MSAIPMGMRIGSLCSGYGGLEMGLLSVTGGQVAWHAEIDPDASRILAHRWPKVPNLGDITAADWTSVEPVDVLTAGYPCQPFSLAGQRKGADDVRHLWPFVAGAVGVLRPRWVFLENVAGHVTLGLDRVVGDLAALRYDAVWCLVRASDAGAPHRRERVFIAAADTDGERRVRAGRSRREAGRAEPSDLRVAAADTDSDAVRQQPVPLAGCGGATKPGVLGPDTAADTSGAGLAVRRVEPDGPQRPTTERGGRQPAADWGPYEPAVTRWAPVVGRPAPRPTEPGRTGKPSLSPAFVEWLMGLPEGHVTAVPGLTRAAQLRALGNGVVPQQAALAARVLLDLHTRHLSPTRKDLPA